MIKRTSAGTSIVGGQAVAGFGISEMGNAQFIVDADTATNSLRIRFQPSTQSGAASGSTTVIRAVATAYLTELGY
jgi:hypothetical protein